MVQNKIPLKENTIINFKKILLTPILPIQINLLINECLTLQTPFLFPFATLCQSISYQIILLMSLQAAFQTLPHATYQRSQRDQGLQLALDPQPSLQNVTSCNLSNISQDFSRTDDNDDVESLQDTLLNKSFDVKLESCLSHRQSKKHVKGIMKKPPPQRKSLPSKRYYNACTAANDLIRKNGSSSNASQQSDVSNLAEWVSMKVGGENEQKWFGVDDANEFTFGNQSADDGMSDGEGVTKEMAQLKISQ